MVLKIASRRGHHEAVIDDVSVVRAIHDKMTGRCSDPLPEEFKTKVPENFRELEGLWKSGKMGYTPAFQKSGAEEISRDFDAEADAVLMFPPITGG